MWSDRPFAVKLDPCKRLNCIESTNVPSVLPMPMDISKIEAMAPDQASLDAARKLLKPSGWPTLGTNGDGLAWGECQGSGSAPYRVMLSEADAGYKCTCPSRKFPCKHTLALMWMRADGKASFVQSEAPDWVGDWLDRRRGAGAARPPVAGNGTTAPKASIAASLEAEPVEAPDPKSEARAAAQRERNRQEREASILAGLDELDRWITDQLSAGLAGFPAVAAQRCRLLAQRLVDAKAGGLAARIDVLLAELYTIPEHERADWLLSALGGLHLIAEAYRRQGDLPEELRADVRQAVGWTMTREALLSDALALRVEAHWLVLAALQIVQADKLRRIETWLARCSDGEGPSFALLVDFVPVSAGAVGKGYAPGESFEAEMVFFPSATPLRALIDRQISPLSKEPLAFKPKLDVAGAMAAHERAIARRPWLDIAPFAVTSARIQASGDVLWLTDPAGRIGVKLASDEREWPLTGTTIDTAFGLYNGRTLSLKRAATPLGLWERP
jgi:SWIM zinc finger